MIIRLGLVEVGGGSVAVYSQSISLETRYTLNRSLNPSIPTSIYTLNPETLGCGISGFRGLGGFWA